MMQLKRLNFNLNLNELTLDSIGSWPLVVRITTIILTGIIVLIIGLWFDTRAQINALESSKQQEIELKAQFEGKQQQAVELQAYKQQIMQMRHIFSGLLRQLPQSSEVPGLLEDISKQGLESGLEFRLIKPLPEVEKAFYAELPIEMEVRGTYHQIATFMSKVSAMSRIVTFNDFKMILDTGNANNGESKDKSVPGGASAAVNHVATLKDFDADPVLNFHVVARTFRYIDIPKNATQLNKQ